jgi:hypothetical protein
MFETWQSLSNMRIAHTLLEAAAHQADFNGTIGFNHPVLQVIVPPRHHFAVQAFKGVARMHLYLRTAHLL